ncbi:uncharacterized protein L199_001627 [Kwoniella botswanensis]|uniref:uncharacterized protein n=1 Tax=Kwoniella botswanensis TaxID=1268659 RepID=UPI00315D51AF
MPPPDPTITRTDRDPFYTSGDGTRNFYIGPAGSDEYQFIMSGSGLIQNAHSKTAECLYSYVGEVTTLEFPFESTTGGIGSITLKSHQAAERDTKKGLEGWKQATLTNAEATFNSKDETFKKNCSEIFSGGIDTGENPISLDLDTRLDFVWQFLVEPNVWPSHE